MKKAQSIIEYTLFLSAIIAALLVLIFSGPNSLKNKFTASYTSSGEAFTKGVTKLSSSDLYPTASGTTGAAASSVASNSAATRPQYQPVYNENGVVIGYGSTSGSESNSGVN